MSKPTDQAKRRAAYRAVEEHFDPSARYVGIGSGTTVIYVVEAIASYGTSVTSPMTFVPTGYQSRDLILGAGLRLGSIDTLSPNPAQPEIKLDICFDGADEIDSELNLIKGGGACLLQEKLVAINAKKFICVADHRKLQPRLLTKYPSIPIEVVPLAAPTVLRALKRLGSSNPAIRYAGATKAGPVVTDNGNFIVDVPFPNPLLTTKDIAEEEGRPGDGTDGKWHVDTLAKTLKGLVGVVETGLFYGLNGDDAAAAQQTKDGGIVQAQKPVVAYLGMESGEVIVRTAKGEERKIDGGGDGSSGGAAS